jgi:hypothetical protein
VIIRIASCEEGGFEHVDTEMLPVTGRDGYGQKTPTVRELIEILKAIPEDCQDLPVVRYVDEGIRGIGYDTSFPREDAGRYTPHVQLW